MDVSGVYLRGDREYPVKSALIQRASRVVLLADASKLTHTAPVKLTDLSTLSMIITNGSVPAPLAHRCAELGVEVVSVPETGSAAKGSGPADLPAIELDR